MASISLKKLVRKSKGSLLWTYLQNENGQNISIIDTNEQLIIGNEIDSQAKKFPIEVDGNILGHVCGDNHAQLLAYFLRDQAEKEDEKKKIANEVLGLYREINLIYNFSDKLALSIDPEAIGSMVLEEASNLIQATAGAVILLDEQNQKPDILASFGNSFIHFDSSSEEGSFWNQVSMGKQSEIRHNLPMEIHVKSLIHAPLKVKHRLMGSIILAHEDAVEHSAADLKLLTTLALQTSSAIESALLYEKRIREAEDRERAMREIHDITVKFVPYDFIKALGGEKLVDVQLGDQVEREVTVLFLDIRDFTSLAEQMTPEDNFKFVNAFNSRLGPLIREHRGFINQYLGDGIMAIFPDNAKDALHAAIDIQQSLLSFNEKRISYGRKPINVGIGMHTGSLIMGITGDEHRLDAATISDTVNTASRIESLTKHFGVSILLSEDSLDQIENKSEFHFRYLGKVQVKGRRKPVKIYECFNGDPEEMIDRKINLLDHFETGLKYYLQGSFNKAIESFDQALQINQHDMPAQLFRSKSNDLAVEGVSPEWSGIEMMDKK